MPTADLFLRSRAWCVAGVLMLAGRLAASEPETFVYKQVGPLAIRADVFRPANDGRKHPIVVWIHGGALMKGSRVREPGADRRIPDRLNAAGIVMVSIDYRLAPETKLPDILSDIEDAFRWVREQGPALFDADPAHLGVIGGSAGGYLTLATGFRVKPRPDVLVSMWGYGDLIGPWYSEPSRQPRHNQFKVTREEAWRQVSGPPVANFADRQGDADIFYAYCRQHGEWPRAVSGWDPHAEAERFHPYMPLQNVTADYPPTLLIHGTNDTDVPYEQSVMMDAELTRHGVEHRFFTATGAEHGLKGAEPAVVEAAESAAVDFLCRHLLPSPALAPSHP